MLSAFPSLLTYGLIAPFLMRLVLGITVLHMGSRLVKAQDYKKTIAYIEILGGILLIIGLFTQVTALILAIGFGYMLIKKVQHRAFLTDGINYYLILFVIALALMFSGAGFWAIDYPL